MSIDIKSGTVKRIFLKVILQKILLNIERK